MYAKKMKSEPLSDMYNFSPESELLIRRVEKLLQKRRERELAQSKR